MQKYDIPEITVIAQPHNNVKRQRKKKSGILDYLTMQSCALAIVAIGLTAMRAAGRLTTIVDAIARLIGR